MRNSSYNCRGYWRGDYRWLWSPYLGTGELALKVMQGTFNRLIPDMRGWLKKLDYYPFEFRIGHNLIDLGRNLADCGG